MTGLADTMERLEAAYQEVRLSLRSIPTKDLAKLHDDSAEGRHPLPPAVMEAACALLCERIQYCGCTDEEPPDRVAALAATVERLEGAYTAARGRLADEARHSLPALPSGATVVARTPEEMKDASGRFILLDALTAIVQAQAMLAQIGAP